MKYPDFEKGVIKIQEGCEEDMIEAEKKAVSILLKKNDNECEMSYGVKMHSMEERLLKRRKTISSSKYINCKFIVGSVAEAERVWNICKYILTDHRSKMTTQVFEALGYFLYNERFWDPHLVAESVATCRRTTGNS